MDQKFLLFSASEKIRTFDAGKRDVRKIPSPNPQTTLTGREVPGLEMAALV